MNFDRISKDWARKRRYPWKPFITIAKVIIQRWVLKYNQFSKETSIFIDLGAGSGRHSEFFKKFCGRLIGLDISFPMCQLNFSASHKVQANLSQLPFRSNIFDGTFAIAAIHHIKPKSDRKACIEEIIRIGKFQSIVGITAWRFYQKKFVNEFLSQFQEMPPRLTNPEIGDIYVPWTISQKNTDQTIHRFYHLFRSVEFRKLMAPLYKIHYSLMGTRGKKNNYLFFGLNLDSNSKN